MTKFNPGDKVRPITAGNEYTVQRIREKDGWLKFENFEHVGFFDPANYELVDAPLRVGDKVMVTIPATVVAGNASFAVLEDAKGGRMYTDIITKSQQGTVELVERPTPTTAEQIRKLEVGTVFTIESFNSWSYVRQADDRIAYLSQGIPERTAPIVDGGWEDSHYKVTALA